METRHKTMAQIANDRRSPLGCLHVVYVKWLNIIIPPALELVAVILAASECWTVSKIGKYFPIFANAAEYVNHGLLWQTDRSCLALRRGTGRLRGVVRMRAAKSQSSFSKTPVVPKTVDVVIMIGNVPHQHCDRGDDEAKFLEEAR